MSPRRKERGDQSTEAERVGGLGVPVYYGRAWLFGRKVETFCGWKHSYHRSRASAHACARRAIEAKSNELRERAEDATWD